VDGHQAANDGPARYSMGWDGLDASSGTVTRDGLAVPVTGDELGCGDGSLNPLPGGGPDSPSDSPFPPDSASPSSSPSVLPSVTPSAPTPGTSPTPRRTPTRAPTTAPARPPTNPPPTTPGPPPNQPPTPTFPNERDPGGGTLDTLYGQNACNGGQTTILYEVSVTDDNDTQKQLSVTLNWSGKYLSGSKTMGIRGTVFYAELGPFTYQEDGNGSGDNLSISITATDSGKLSKTISGKPVSVLPCRVIT
jgi:hypothetical protein